MGHYWLAGLFLVACPSSSEAYDSVEPSEYLYFDSLSWYCDRSLSTSLAGTNTSSFNEFSLTAASRSWQYHSFFSFSLQHHHSFYASPYTLKLGRRFLYLVFLRSLPYFSLLHEFLGPLCWQQILFGFSAV
jgi:hypothetical protein